MPGRIRSGLVTAVATVGIGALIVAPTSPPPPAAPVAPMEVHDVRLAASTAPPIGAIPLAFIANQFQYCSVICPYVVQGAVTVPIATVLTPVTFQGSLQTTGSLLQSIGAAAASVTGAANAAATPIIENDVYRVVPKAFNNLEVAVVELINVGAAVFQPGEFLQTVNSARENILAALNQPLPPPAPTETGAETLPQVLAVEAIKVFSAVAFQAGELLLLGIVQTADAVAQELAQSGDPGAALAAGAVQVTETITTAEGIVNNAVDTAVTNISASLNDPFPSPTKTSQPPADKTPAASAVSSATHQTKKSDKDDTDGEAHTDEPRKTQTESANQPKNESQSERSNKPKDDKKADRRASD